MFGVGSEESHGELPLFTPEDGIGKLPEFQETAKSEMLVARKRPAPMTDAPTLDNTVAALISSVRNGRVNGCEFCAEVSRLNPFDRARVLQEFLREYKNVNNFTPTTGEDDGVVA